MTRRLLPFLLAPALLGVLGLAACGTDSGTGSGSGQVAVSAAFYPLAYLTEQVGGDHVDVSLLTKPGSEPHDLELTAKEVVDLSKADLVVYESDFQPAVDDAVASLAQDTSFDVAPAAGLDLASTGNGHEEAVSPTDNPPAGESLDPHFWLDPMKFADVGDAVATKLSSLDPDHAADYSANAARFRQSLTALDTEYREGLATCESRDLVTSHEAFGYLAQAYDLNQESITGLSPETEPSAAQLAAITRFVRDHDVTTIYAEVLVSSKVAETVAQETGATVAVLDPIEGITDASKGTTYLEVMRSNLETLKTGQRCS